jgi:hypothetical protein
MENDPVLIVGILPGCTKSETDSYAKTNNSTVAMYVDSDRSFEKALLALGMLPKEISLSNTMQCLVADGEGILHHGRWNDPAGSLKQALGTAKWKTDPATIPDALKPAWRALEFGQVAVAAPLITQALKSSDAKVKEAAQTLEKAIKDEIAARLAEAKTKADAGEKWPAYKLYDSVATDFKTFAESRPATSEMGKLRSDKVVAKELQARTALETILRDYLKSPIKSKQAQGKQMLQQLAQQFPETEAAAAAKALQ